MVRTPSKQAHDVCEKPFPFLPSPLSIESGSSMHPKALLGEFRCRATRPGRVFRRRRRRSRAWFTLV